MNIVALHWSRPRSIWVIVDNPSWILPYARRLVERIAANGDEARLCRSHAEVGTGTVAFYLGCIHMAPETVLARNRYNLVVHESDLPQGRGFSPLTWQILAGRKDIPVCLLEAQAEADAGPVIYRENLHFAGHELVDELRAALGRLTEELCLRYLDEPEPPAGRPQTGIPTHYARRRPEDSRLDPGRSLAEQFDLLRVVDNERYPAFFELRGHRYRVRIDKLDEADGDGELRT